MKYLFIYLFLLLDLDIDDSNSHVEGLEGASVVENLISAGESESESDGETAVEIDEHLETPYIQSLEDEFGAVNYLNYCDL